MIHIINLLYVILVKSGINWRRYEINPTLLSRCNSRLPGPVQTSYVDTVWISSLSGCTWVQPRGPNCNSSISHIRRRQMKILFQKKKGQKLGKFFFLIASGYSSSVFGPLALQPWSYSAAKRRTMKESSVFVFPLMQQANAIFNFTIFLNFTIQMKVNLPRDPTSWKFLFALLIQRQPFLISVLFSFWVRVWTTLLDPKLIGVRFGSLWF